MSERTPDIPEDEVLGYFDSLSNWGRWGADDEGGTLNLITPERTARAARLATTGISISCSRTLAPRPSPWVGFEYTHRMNSSGEAAPEKGPGAATDWFGLSFHGYDHTHIDSHSHMFWDQRMYNGRSAKLCTTARGALVGGVEPAMKGIIGRGIFVDWPRLRNKEWLEPGEGISPDELDSWFTDRELKPEPGDALWIRTGRDAAERSDPYDQGADGSPGISAACLRWLREKDIAVLVTDVATDVRPSVYEHVPDPVHLVGIVAMGLWIVDNADMGSLAATCASEGRYEFLSIIVPLALRRSTGSPVNPIAAF
jgi:kynurenine formamidase